MVAGRPVAHARAVAASANIQRCVILRIAYEIQMVGYLDIRGIPARDMHANWNTVSYRRTSGALQGMYSDAKRLGPGLASFPDPERRIPSRSRHVLTQGPALKKSSPTSVRSWTE